MLAWPSLNEYVAAQQSNHEPVWMLVWVMDPVTKQRHTVLLNPWRFDSSIHERVKW